MRAKALVGIDMEKISKNQKEKLRKISKSRKNRLKREKFVSERENSFSPPLDVNIMLQEPSGAN